MVAFPSGDREPPSRRRGRHRLVAFQDAPAAPGIPSPDISPPSGHWGCRRLRRPHLVPVAAPISRERRTVKRTNERPLVFGYYSARTGIPTEQAMDTRARLTAFACREGYALADIFAEPSEEPSVALQALCQSAERREVAAVVVADMTDLGTTPRVQQVTRERLHGAGIQLLVLLGGAAASSGSTTGRGRPGVRLPAAQRRPDDRSWTQPLAVTP